MNSLKRKNMMAVYNGFRGGETLKAVLAQIPAGLVARLTGAELGAVMSAVNAAYHNGKAAAGAEAMDNGGAVWVNLEGGGRMVTMDGQPGEIEIADYIGHEHTTRRYKLIPPAPRVGCG